MTKKVLEQMLELIDINAETNKIHRELDYYNQRFEGKIAMYARRIKYVKDRYHKLEKLGHRKASIKAAIRKNLRKMEG